MAFADLEPPDPAEGIATTPSSDNARPTSLQQSQPQQQRVRHEQAETQTAARLPHIAATRHERNISSINIGGYQYTRAWSSRRKIVYRCSYYRGTGCMGRVEFLAASMEYGNFIQHTCQQDHVVAAHTVDILEPMREAVDDLARSDVALSAAAIWSRINDQFTAEHQALIGLTREQVLRRVYRVRNRHFGGNIHGRIEMPPLSRDSDADNRDRADAAEDAESEVTSAVVWTWYEELIMRSDDASDLCFMPYQEARLENREAQLNEYLKFEKVTELAEPVTSVAAPLKS